MAYDVEVIDFETQPIENEDGTLEGLRLTKRTRTMRRSEDGKVLDYGYGKREVETEMVIPLYKLGTVMSTLVSWPEYYASGESARDRRDPVRWPNSLSTVEG